jgi:hypothetical protein
MRSAPVPGGLSMFFSCSAARLVSGASAQSGSVSSQRRHNQRSGARDDRPAHGVANGVHGSSVII